MRPGSWFRRIGWFLAGLLVLVVVAVAFMDWNWFKHPIERMASAKSGRSVTLAGPLQVHLWSLTPTVTLTGVTLGNPPWETDPQPMARIPRAEIHLKLLPLLKG
ncbi:MAG TPA: AsmA family protein, partial [Steroidobacteraceae bacterium]|nr:AsmA family protein [Steroidobacteraceae bacterium]